jgi:ABC-2 type transport system ATP-binding protein
MTATLRVMNLTKTFGSVMAVDNVSFSATQGEVVGFLGPNGAGKSTTMKMITGFITPSSGTAYIDGYDIMEQPLAAKRIFGYLPEGAPCYPDMTVLNFLEFIAAIRKLKPIIRDERMSAVVTQLHLETVLHKRIEILSKGFQRRLGLAQALIHDPKVLLLDEPTDGLDPNQKREVRNLIADLAHDKVIIISTHMLEEVQALCDRVIVINAGKLILDTTPAELQQETAQKDAISALENVFASLETAQ